MGYAGNCEPSFIIPTVIGTRDGNVSRSSGKAAGSIDDLDFVIGDDALGSGSSGGSSPYNVNYPVRHGMVENWDNMERFWQRSVFKYLRCDPSEHAFLLTEPPMNTPENRELTAEIMFETFNVRQPATNLEAADHNRAKWQRVAGLRGIHAHDHTNPIPPQPRPRAQSHAPPHAHHHALRLASTAPPSATASPTRPPPRLHPRRCPGCTSPCRPCSPSPPRGPPSR
jgi:hypothetical protein